MRQELAAAQDKAQGYKELAAGATAEATAAREAEQRLHQQLVGEQRRMEKVRAVSCGSGGGALSDAAGCMHGQSFMPTVSIQHMLGCILLHLHISFPHY